jgi:predicted nucleotidyltransferase
MRPASFSARIWHMLPLNSRQTAQLARIGSRYGLKLIILHGSYVTGKAHPHSDLDIAVSGLREMDKDKFWDLYGELADILDDDPERELDLKTLDRKDPLFLYQVMKDSRLLYGSPSEYQKLKAYAFRLYQDSRDLRRLERVLTHRLLERIKQDVGP